MQLEVLRYKVKKTGESGLFLGIKRENDIYKATAGISTIILNIDGELRQFIQDAVERIEEPTGDQDGE